MVNAGGRYRSAQRNAISNHGGKLAFVGDGINDAPVIARADVGIAMGGLGSDAAIETADVVLMTDSPLRMVEAVNIARQTRKIVRQNIVVALLVKLVFVTLGTMGMASMWEAVFADMGVSRAAVLNSTRVLQGRGTKLDSGLLRPGRPLSAEEFLGKCPGAPPQFRIADFLPTGRTLRSE
jgi:cation transport ATPase